MKAFGFNSLRETQEKTKAMGKAEFLSWVERNADYHEIKNYLGALSKNTPAYSDKYLIMSLIIGALNKLIRSDENKTNEYINEIRNYFERYRDDFTEVLIDWSCLGEKNRKKVYPITLLMRQILKDLLIKDNWVT